MTAEPGAHPDPPAGFGSLEFPLEWLPPEARLWRFHSSSHGAIYFGHEVLGRFDDPQGEFGVLYAAQDIEGAFAETFGRLRDPRLLTRRELGGRTLSLVTVTHAVALVDMRAEGLSRIGADARLTTGDYTVAQRWSRAIWSRRPVTAEELLARPYTADGLLYRSRHDPARDCVALFDRPHLHLSSEGRGSLMDAANEELLADLLDRYNFGLL